MRFVTQLVNEKNKLSLLYDGEDLTGNWNDDKIHFNLDKDQFTENGKLIMEKMLVRLEIILDQLQMENHLLKYLKLIQIDQQLDLRQIVILMQNKSNKKVKDVIFIIEANY